MAQSLTASDVLDALHRRHPAHTVNSFVGEWTCVREWRNIDLLAMSAWGRGEVVGYEVKVSRGDMRQELLRPYKRSAGVAMSNRFFFAVPAGLLKPMEVAWEEPEWEAGDFERVMCPGVPEFGGFPHARARRQRFGGLCSRGWSARGGAARLHTVNAPWPVALELPSWMAQEDTQRVESWAAMTYRNTESTDRAVCWRCDGKGWLRKSRVERHAPQLWVPRDCGLIEVTGRGCRVVKQAPRRDDPVPVAKGRKELNELVRFVSVRPDPRHVRSRT